MKCSVIDECRCFAYDDVPKPREQQFCGVRRGGKVLHCPESDCCAGGCPGQTPGTGAREPFRIIERPDSEHTTSLEDLRNRVNFKKSLLPDDIRFYMAIILMLLLVVFTT